MLHAGCMWMRIVRAPRRDDRTEPHLPPHRYR